MFKQSNLAVLHAFALCCFGALTVPAQTPLPLIEEIKLPVHPHHGTFGGGFWAIGFSSEGIFQFKVAPDQSLLVLYPVTNGKWELIRLRKWWTATPETEELDLPGWTEANTLKEFYFGADLLITQDGNYAISLGSVASVKDAHNIPFPPNKSIENKPDLLIAIIDLKRWRIVGAFHTAIVDPYAEFRGASIVDGKWIALEGLDKASESVRYEHVFDRFDHLISIPDLKPGPGCMTKDPDILTLPAGKPSGDTSALSNGNDNACRSLLAAAGVPSMRTLEWFIYLGHDPEPRNLKVLTWPSFLAEQQDREKGTDSSELIWPQGEFDQGYWTSNEWDMYGDNPPFESSTGSWYQLHKPKEEGSYLLGKFANGGQLVKEREADFISNPQCGSRFGCVCDVVDASEQQSVVLTLCRNQSVNFTGGFDWHSQWIAAFRSDDLSKAGEAELTTKPTRVGLASAEGRSYVAAVEQGKVVRIYLVPAP